MALALDLAAVISTTLEGILYGFSVFMFGVTLYILQQNSRRLEQQMNWRMFFVSCALLACSTAHMIIDVVRLCRGLVLKRDTFLGGPIGFFSQPSESTFVAKNVVYTMQTLLGDGVLVYRCFVVWDSWLVVAFPIVLWFWIGVVGSFSVHSAAVAPSGAGTVFIPSIGEWITAFYASTLATNFIVSALLGYKIWITNRRVARMRQGSLLPIVRVIADAGVLYSVALIAALACFVQKSNGQYILLDIITPIISITFYMVIIRVGLASAEGSEQSTIHSSGQRNAHALPTTRSHHARELETEVLPMARLQVHITKMHESDRDHDLHERDHSMNDAGSEFDRKGTFGGSEHAL
ncbi:hypothetical protein C2E23DRAFT_771786 [Lenzites betulinus]|nr:hypothetical protein C2E23DRAFT_771786 [Lenzites betulinus]